MSTIWSKLFVLQCSIVCDFTFLNKRTATQIRLRCIIKVVALYIYVIYRFCPRFKCDADFQQSIRSYTKTSSHSSMTTIFRHRAPLQFCSWQAITFRWLVVSGHSGFFPHSLSHFYFSCISLFTLRSNVYTSHRLYCRVYTNKHKYLQTQRTVVAVSYLSVVHTVGRRSTKRTSHVRHAQRTFNNKRETEASYQPATL